MSSHEDLRQQFQHIIQDKPDITTATYRSSIPSKSNTNGTKSNKFFVAILFVVITIFVLKFTEFGAKITNLFQNKPPEPEETYHEIEEDDEDEDEEKKDPLFQPL